MNLSPGDTPAPIALTRTSGEVLTFESTMTLPYGQYGASDAGRWDVKTLGNPKPGVGPLADVAPAPKSGSSR